MKKRILVVLSLFAGLMFSCSNEDINIPPSEEQALNEKVLSIEDARVLLKDFIVDVHTKSGISTEIKGHKVKEFYIDSKDVLPVSAEIAATAIPDVLRSYGLSAGSFTAYSIEKCIQSLRNGYPILFMVQSSKGGHAWICDAWKRHIYDSATYYDYLDMNWGWSGMSNGFFSINNPLSFPTDKATFNSDFEILINIH